MNYQKKTLSLTGHDRPECVLEKIRGVDGIVVNIAGSRDESPIFFSVENLQALLSGSTDTLLLETLATQDYNRLMVREIEAVKKTAKGLLEGLRDHFVSDLTDGMNHLLDQIENMALLLSCAVLKSPRSDLGRQFGKLRQLYDQLGRSYRELRDNVRCMDDIQYGILPMLQNLRDEMQTE